MLPLQCRGRQAGSVHKQTACYPYNAEDGKPDQFTTPAVELAALEYAICGLHVDGTVECGGSPVKNLAGAKGISCTDHTCCAVVANGGVSCWGAKNEMLGYLGDSADEARPITEKVPVATSIVIRGDQACVRTPVGGAYCWGRDGSSKLSRPRGVRSLAAIGSSDVGTVGDDGALSSGDELVHLTDVVDVSNQCAVHADGGVSCWGVNQFGALGDGHPLYYPSPTRVPGLERVSELAMGTSGVCALTGTRMTCWGEGSKAVLSDLTGQRALTRGYTLCTFSPGKSISCIVWAGTGWLSGGFEVMSPDLAAPPAGTRVLALQYEGLSAATACAVDQGDHLLCSDGYQPWRAIATPGAVASVVPVAHGFCAVLRDGRVGCVNYAADADAFPDHPRFELVKSLRNIEDVAERGPPTCARTNEGDVECWDRLDNGSPEAPPSLVPDLHHVTGLAVADFHSCALVSSSIWCWGASDEGVLGAGTLPPIIKGSLVREPAKTPVPARTTFAAKQIVASGNTVCALDDKGHVWCWGSDVDGLIGQGRIIETATPVRVVDIGPR